MEKFRPDLSHFLMALPVIIGQLFHLFMAERDIHGKDKKYILTYSKCNSNNTHQSSAMFFLYSCTTRNASS